jgi:hypothetical protein
VSLRQLLLVGELSLAAVLLQALHVAAMRGSCAALDLLLAAGIPAATRSSRGWTPFDEACAARAMTAARCVVVAGWPARRGTPNCPHLLYLWCGER